MRYEPRSKSLRTNSTSPCASPKRLSSTIPSSLPTLFTSTPLSLPPSLPLCQTLKDSLCNSSSPPFHLHFSSIQPMASTSNTLSNLHLQPPTFPPKHHSSFSHKTSQISHFRVWRRRRLKSHKKFTIQSHLTPDNFNFLQNLISNFPWGNSLDVFAPALGFASGVALYISRKNPNRSSRETSVGEWIMFTTPTPFNRFVLLRCPSISFDGSEVIDDKLVSEDRHFVKLDSMRLEKGMGEREEDKLVYQRVCVSCEDGGVISLDWPANLDLKEERGLDTTLLLVPGTPEGSMEKNVRSFVCEALKRGCFPIVMNPRGCAGSPLTTARLFTAADSDDICTAIQFINNARPWTTMMAVGWGYGANMLTKYLEETAEKTPLTAATCIDNPFDLEETTRSSPHHIALDRKLTSGLIDILRSNKELFQGRGKGFNVDKALSATSVRDFEREISAVSYGAESIEEFYSKSSTRESVDKLTVPVLFIQNDNETVPPFSIPRSSIAENPFTSLLLSSSFPSTAVTSEKSPAALTWCHNFALEWLTAIELGLLKGRHPLLKDVDVTINPSKDLALVEGTTLDKDGDVNKFFDLSQLNAVDGHPVDPIRSMLNRSDAKANANLGPWKYLFEGAKSREEEHNDMANPNSSGDTELDEVIKDHPVDNEESQVLPTAQVVMNMLDVTMPGTLADEQKKKVLTAMEQGETLMKALQGAVPEDVRGKLTASVSEIMQNKGTNLNIDRLVKMGRIPNVSPEAKLNIEETFRDLTSAAGGYNDVRPLEQIKVVDEMSQNTDKKQSATEKRAKELESDSQLSHKFQGSLDQVEPESENSRGQEEFPKERQSSGNEENESITGSSPNKDGQAKRAVESDDAVGMKDTGNNGGETTQMSTNEANGIQKNEEKNLDVSTDQDKIISTTKTEESLSPTVSSSDNPLIEKGPNNFQPSEDQSMQLSEEQNRQNSSKSEESAPASVPTPNPPSMSVSQALDALTGFDDSTQMAVNSVFGVLEGMIDQLEEGSEQQNGGKQNESEDGKSISVPEESPVSETGRDSRNKECMEKRLPLESDPLKLGSSDYLVRNIEKYAISNQDAMNDSDEKQLTQSPSPHFKDKAVRPLENNLINLADKETDKWRIKDMVNAKFSVGNLDKVRHVAKSPLPVTLNPYGDFMYNEYLRQYLLSKIPNTQSLDLDSTTCLLLDYFPEDGKWMLLDQSESSTDTVGNVETHDVIDRRGQVRQSPQQTSHTDDIIETSYVVLDTEKKHKPIKEYEAADPVMEKYEQDRASSEELVHLVKNIVVDSLTVEVCRRLGLAHFKEMEADLARDLEQVAEEVSLSVEHGTYITSPSETKEPAVGKVGTLNGEHVIKKVSSAVKHAVYLRKVLPVGVIVGSILASLRKHFNVATQNDNFHTGATTLVQGNSMGDKFHDPIDEIRNVDRVVPDEDQHSGFESLGRPEILDDDTVMVGAVTAALGASAYLVHQQGKESRSDRTQVSPGSLSEKLDHHKEDGKLLNAVSEKNQSNIVTSLAEKAMSVAGPVVPTKNDGGVDQERLVAMLADLGQKGGMLRLIGKVALLWGGIRGAISLTEKLISFLRLADRPLFQRILGFACMVLVLWSPVVIPLFPSLVQSWIANRSAGIAGHVSIVGLYTAMMILIMLWGKRIRGYKDPFEQYGLDLTSFVKLYDFLKGLIGGAGLVLSIHSTNVLLGYSNFSWYPSLASSSPDAMLRLKLCGEMLLMVGRGIATATVVAVVEELLFRSWLPEEIATDLGHIRAVIISGLAFAMLQRSPQAIPALWLLSLTLSGVRQRSKGSLAIPIGIHAGIVASNFVMKGGEFLTYKSEYPQWLTGRNPLQPFSGVVGLAFCLILAIVLYPWNSRQRKRSSRAIRKS